MPNTCKKSDNYKISIVTVVFNGFYEIENTIKSVINQSYKNLEYIIVDGGSTDGTIDIIKNYSDNISNWISEKDDGIYYAMNKANKMANGDYILFLNAGDVFISNEIVETVFKTVSNDLFSLVAGRTKVYYKKIDLDVVSPNPNKKGYLFSHQSTFINKSIYKQLSYNTIFSILNFVI